MCPHLGVSRPLLDRSAIKNVPLPNFAFPLSQFAGSDDVDVSGHLHQADSVVPGLLEGWTVQESK